MKGKGMNKVIVYEEVIQKYMKVYESFGRV